MPVEFLENPRRSPRARVRCVVSVSAGDAPPIRAISEDVGPHGCQLVAPQPFQKGARLLLELVEPGFETDPLLAIGTVAWVSPHEPWRLGIAFLEVSWPEAARFFDHLMAHQPSLANQRQVPYRISLGTMVWLAPPPRFVVDFTADEVVLLGVVGSGATVFELKKRLGDPTGRFERAFFSLLSSGAITLSRGGSIPFDSWSDLLRRLESEHAVASLECSSGPTAESARPTPQPARLADPIASVPLQPTAMAPRVPSPEAKSAWPPAPPSADHYDGSAGLDLDLNLEVSD